jgi:ATP phosphoribosyltransferase
MKERLTIAIPTGELAKSVRPALESAGITLPAGRALYAQTEGLPIDVVAMRPGNMPDAFRREDSSINVIVAGVDTLTEAGIKYNKDTILPVENKSRLIYAANNRAVRRILPSQDLPSVNDTNLVRQQKRNDIETALSEIGSRGVLLDLDENGKSIVTKFPNMTTDFIIDNGLPPSNFHLEVLPGSTEGAQFYLPNADGLTDITDTKASVKQNDLYEVAEIMGQIGMAIVAGDLTEGQEWVLNEFYERVMAVA